MGIGFLLATLLLSITHKHHNCLVSVAVLVVVVVYALNVNARANVGMNVVDTTNVTWRLTCLEFL